MASFTEENQQNTTGTLPPPEPKVSAKAPHEYADLLIMLSQISKEENKANRDALVEQLKIIVDQFNAADLKEFIKSTSESAKKTTEINDKKIFELSKALEQYTLKAKREAAAKFDDSVFDKEISWIYEKLADARKSAEKYDEQILSIQQQIEQEKSKNFDHIEDSSEKERAKNARDDQVNHLMDRMQNLIDSANEKEEQAKKLELEAPKEIAKIEEKREKGRADLFERTLENLVKENEEAFAAFTELKERQEKKKEYIVIQGTADSAVENSDGLEKLLQTVQQITTKLDAGENVEEIDKALLQAALKQINASTTLTATLDNFAEKEKEFEKEEAKKVRNIWKSGIEAFSNKISETLQSSLFSEMFGSEIGQMFSFGSDMLKGFGRSVLNIGDTTRATAESIAEVTDAVTGIWRQPASVFKGLRSGLDLESSEEVQEKSLAWQKRQAVAEERSLPLTQAFTRAALRRGSIYTHDIHSEEYLKSIADNLQSLPPAKLNQILTNNNQLSTNLDLPSLSTTSNTKDLNTSLRKISKKLDTGLFGGSKSSPIKVNVVENKSWTDSTQKVLGISVDKNRWQKDLVVSLRQLRWEFRNKLNKFTVNNVNELKKLSSVLSDAIENSSHSLASQLIDISDDVQILGTDVRESLNLVSADLSNEFKETNDSIDRMYKMQRKTFVLWSNMSSAEKIAFYRQEGLARQAQNARNEARRLQIGENKLAHKRWAINLAESRQARNEERKRWLIDQRNQRLNRGKKKDKGILGTLKTMGAMVLGPLTGVVASLAASVARFGPLAAAMIGRAFGAGGPLTTLLAQGQNFGTAQGAAKAATGFGITIARTAADDSLSVQERREKMAGAVGGLAGEGIGAAVGAWLGGPMGATIGASIGAVAGEWLWDTFAPFWAKVVDWFKPITRFFEDYLSGLFTNWKLIFSYISQGFSEAGWIVEDICDWFVDAWDDMKRIWNWIANLFSSIRLGFLKLLNKIPGFRGDQDEAIAELEKEIAERKQENENIVKNREDRDKKKELERAAKREEYETNRKDARAEKAARDERVAKERAFEDDEIKTRQARIAIWEKEDSLLELYKDKGIEGLRADATARLKALSSEDLSSFADTEFANVLKALKEEIETGTKASEAQLQYQMKSDKDLQKIRSDISRKQENEVRQKHGKELLAEPKGAIGTTVAILKKGVNAVTGTTQEHLSGASAATQNAINTATELAQQGLQAASGVVQGQAPGILQQAASTVTPYIQSAGQAVVNAGQTAWNYLQSGELSTDFKNFFSNFGEKSHESWESAKQYAQDAWEFAKTKSVEFWNSSTLEDFKTKFSDFAGFSENSWNSVTQFAENSWDKISAKASEVFTGLSEKLPEITNIISEKTEKISVSNLKENLSFALNKAEEWIPNSLDFMQGMVSKTKDAIPGIIDKIQDSSPIVLNQMKEWGSTTWNSIESFIPDWTKTKVKNVTEIISTKFQDTLKIIKPKITENVPDIQHAVDILGSTSRDVISEMKAMTENAVHSLKISSNNEDSKGFKDVVNGAEKNTKKLTDKLGEIVEALKKMPNGGNVALSVANQSGGMNLSKDIPADIDSLGVLLTNKTWGFV